jgi:hypothetical protein
LTSLDNRTAGVTPEPLLPPPLPLPLMICEEVQLETPPARMASNATSKSALRRRARPKGTSANPQAKGRTGHTGGREELVEV